MGKVSSTSPSPISSESNNQALKAIAFHIYCAVPQKVKVSLFRPITVSLTEAELSGLPDSEKRVILEYKIQRAIGDEKVAEFATDNIDYLRKQVMSLCQSSSHPLVVKLSSNLNRTCILETMNDYNDPEAIIEEVYYSYTDTGQRLQKSIWNQLDKHNDRVRQLLAEHGWTAATFSQILLNAGLKSDDNPGPEQIPGLLEKLPADDRAIAKGLIEKASGWTCRIYSELAKEFSIDIDSFRKDDLQNAIYEPYVIASRAAERDAQPLDLNTVRDLFLEERGRVIWRNSGHVRVDHSSWLREFHPEMSKDVLVTNNTV